MRYIRSKRHTYDKNSKTIALLFAMFNLGGMIAIPGLSLAPTTTAYAQNLDIPFIDEEEEDAFFCITGEGRAACFESLAECQEAAADITQSEDECQRFETLPEGAGLCTVVDGSILCTTED